MVTHGNLLHNSELIRRGFAHDADERRRCVWLPLVPRHGADRRTSSSRCTSACPASLMSPVAVPAAAGALARGDLPLPGPRPAAARTSPTTCASRKSTAEQREALDLSRWSVAFNGAEPVRADTLDRFAAAFAPRGFRREAFFPATASPRRR